MRVGGALASTSNGITGKKRSITKGRVTDLIQYFESLKKTKENIIKGDPLIMKFAKLLDITAKNKDEHDSSKNRKTTYLTDERKPSANDSYSDSDSDSDSESDMDVDESKPSANDSDSDMDVVKEQKSTKNDTILNEITEEMKKMNIKYTKTKETIFSKIASLFNTKPKVSAEVPEKVSFPKSIKIENITSIENADSFFKEGKYYLLTNETLANETLANNLSKKQISSIKSTVRFYNNEEPDSKVKFLNERDGRGIYEGSFKGVINTEEGGIILLFLSEKKMKKIVIDEQKKTKKINEIVIKALQILKILIGKNKDIFVIPKKSKKKYESNRGIEPYNSIIKGDQSIFHGENGIHGVNETWINVLVSFRENKPNELGITPMDFLKTLIREKFLEKIILIKKNDEYKRLVQEISIKVEQNANDTEYQSLKESLSSMNNIIHRIALEEESINISILEAFFELYINHNNNEIKSQELKNRIKESWLINTHGLEISTLLEHYSTIHVQQFSNFYISEYLNRLHGDAENEVKEINYSVIEQASNYYTFLNDLTPESKEILEIFTQQPQYKKFYFGLKATTVKGINTSVNKGNIQRALDNLFIANKSQTPEISFLDGSLGGGSLNFCGLFHQGRFHKITMNHNGFNTEKKIPDNNQYYIETECKFFISAYNKTTEIIWIKNNVEPQEEPTIESTIEPTTESTIKPTLQAIQDYINLNQEKLNKMIDKILKSPTGRTPQSDAKSPTGITAPSVGALKSPTGNA